MNGFKKITLYMHAGSGNHGCEAIVNSLCHILTDGGVAGASDITLASYRKDEDDSYSLSELCNTIQMNSFDNHKLSHVLYYGYRKLTGDAESFMRYKLGKVLRIPTDVAISIGGDNYCYEDMLNDLKLAHNVYLRKKVKTILLGCSIEPELISRPDIKEDLAKYDTIIARESITYDALLQEFTGNTPHIELVPDPAFTLGIKEAPLPKVFVPGNTVGINLSPMVQNNESTSGITFESYKNLIKYIVNYTDMQVALIPHVVWNGNDDRVPEHELYDYCAYLGITDRVTMIEDADAETLKGYISKCRFFIGARTHSTIAAYSCIVPTLVVGYSVKARGIAKDLFPGYDVENLVLQVQKITDDKSLTEAFKWIMANEDALRKNLESVMPAYRQKAKDVTKLI